MAMRPEVNVTQTPDGKVVITVGSAPGSSTAQDRRSPDIGRNGATSGGRPTSSQSDSTKSAKETLERFSEAYRQIEERCHELAETVAQLHDDLWVAHASGISQRPNGSAVGELGEPIGSGLPPVLRLVVKVVHVAVRPHRWVPAIRGKYGVWRRYGFRAMVRAMVWGMPFRVTDGQFTGPDLFPDASGDEEGYRSFVARDGVSMRMRRRLVEQAIAWPLRPLISVLTPVYNVDPQWLSQTIESVIAQVYENWELILVDDGSTNPRTRYYLDTLTDGSLDRRCLLVRREDSGGISTATNEALSRAQGEFVALLDHDDLLHPRALWDFVAALQKEPDLLAAYTDEDKVDGAGHHYQPFFKPDWSPTLLLGMNYINHLSIVSASLLRELGGWRQRFDGSQDHDLWLRIGEQTDRIGHIPDVRYHWRALERNTASIGAQESRVPQVRLAAAAGQDAVQAALDRRGHGAVVSSLHSEARYRVVWNTPSKPPKVSAIIPTRDHWDMLERCLEGIRRCGYPNIEVTVVDNGSSDSRVRRGLLNSADVVVEDARPFNFSRLINAGVRASSGDLLLLLNNDVEMLGGDWLQEMVGQIGVAGVGVVGAKLLFPDLTIQHAGVVKGLWGVCGHIWMKHHRDYTGYFEIGLFPREVSAVTGACLLTTRAAFEEVGGFREEFPVNYNDIAYCLDVLQKGKRVIYTPHATLIHREWGTRHPVVHEWEKKLFRATYPNADRYYSPHLSLDRPYGLNLASRSRDRQV